MDIYAAASLKAAPKGTAMYKTAQPAVKNDFNKIFNEVSFEGRKQAARPNKSDRKLQENYDSVLASSGICYNQVRINDGAQSVNEAEELVMGVSEDLTAGNDSGIQAAFGDITKAFSDMISTELLSQYIIKNYPNGTAGQNPMEEFSQKVSDIMFDAIEDRSGFTKTQMTNPNMTVDIIGLDKIVNDDFIQDITDDIVSVVLQGDDNNKDLTGQIVKNAFSDIISDPARFVAVVNDKTQEVPVQEAVIQETPVQETQPDTADIPQAAPADIQTPAENIQTAPAEAPQEPEVRMILMSDGTYIPENAIMKSGFNVPDEKGIYPAGTEYIEATPLIGKGSSPATAVLMAKVGDDDGLIRPSDFVKARNIVFTRHENVYEKSAPSVYMPINGTNEAVSGVIEYKGAQSELMDMSSGDAENSGGDMTGEKKPMQNNDFALNVNTDTSHAVKNTNISQTPNNTEVFRVPPQARAEAIAQMTERMTNNLIQSETGGVKQMQIQLQPETLGNIVIKLESVRGEVNVRIIASNPEVRDMIAQSAAQMGESIKASGVNLNNINVSSASQQQENFDGSSGNSAYYNDSQQNQRQQQQENTNYKEYMEAAENEKIRKVIDSIRSMGM